MGGKKKCRGLTVHGTALRGAAQDGHGCRAAPLAAAHGACSGARGHRILPGVHRALLTGLPLCCAFLRSCRQEAPPQPLVSIAAASEGILKRCALLKPVQAVVRGLPQTHDSLAQSSLALRPAQQMPVSHTIPRHQISKQGPAAAHERSPTSSLATPTDMLTVSTQPDHSSDAVLGIPSI